MGPFFFALLGEREQPVQVRKKDKYSRCGSRLSSLALNRGERVLCFVLGSLNRLLKGFVFMGMRWSEDSAELNSSS